MTRPWMHWAGLTLIVAGTAAQIDLSARTRATRVRTVELLARVEAQVTELRQLRQELAAGGLLLCPSLPAERSAE